MNSQVPNKNYPPSEDGERMWREMNESFGLIEKRPRKGKTQRRHPPKKAKQQFNVFGWY